MNSGLESKILESVRQAEDVVRDYESLIMENRRLKNTVERLESEKREFRRKVENISERVKAHMKTRA